jgi:hypothetical protein
MDGLSTASDIKNLSVNSQAHLNGLNLVKKSHTRTSLQIGFFKQFGHTFRANCTMFFMRIKNGKNQRIP